MMARGVMALRGIDPKHLSILEQRRLPQGWKQVPSSRYAWVAKGRISGRDLFFKLFLPRGPLEGIKALLRGSRSQRFVRESERLKALGFGAPDVLGWDRSLRLRIRGMGWVLTGRVEGTGVMDFWHGEVRFMSRGERRRFLAAVGREVARLHETGICHGDLRANNILVQEREVGFRFSFIDNERNRFYIALPEDRAVKNLVQLNRDDYEGLSIEERLILFLSYSRARRLGRDEARRLLRAVIARTDQVRRRSGKKRLSAASKES